MVAATDSPTAPWHVVLANSKRYARVQVLELLNHEIEAGLIRRGITPPKSRGQDYLA
jgi:polyphosphate kinase 2 (PPK2 family)